MSFSLKKATAVTHNNHKQPDSILEYSKLFVNNLNIWVQNSLEHVMKYRFGVWIKRQFQVDIQKV